jgi:hypothetical protein
VSVEADAGGALGALVLLQADMPKAARTAKVINRPWVMYVSWVHRGG